MTFLLFVATECFSSKYIQGSISGQNYSLISKKLVAVLRMEGSAIVIYILWEANYKKNVITLDGIWMQKPQT